MYLFVVKFLKYIFRMSALHQAALIGSLEMMGMLLEQGASVGITDNKGMNDNIRNYLQHLNSCLL